MSFGGAPPCFGKEQGNLGNWQLATYYASHTMKKETDTHSHKTKPSKKHIRISTMHKMHAPNDVECKPTLGSHPKTKQKSIHNKATLCVCTQSSHGKPRKLSLLFFYGCKANGKSALHSCKSKLKSSQSKKKTSLLLACDKDRKKTAHDRRILGLHSRNKTHTKCPSFLCTQD